MVTTMPSHPPLPPMVHLILLHVVLALLVRSGSFCSAYSTMRVDTAAFTSHATRVEIIAPFHSPSSSSEGGEGVDVVTRNHPHHASSPGAIVGGTSRRAFLRRSTTKVAVATTAFSSTLLLPPRRAHASMSSSSTDPSSLIGRIAPDFELPNTRGNIVNLDDLTSGGTKWVVLYFYPGAFTSGCTLEARKFQELVNEFRIQANARIVGVSVDGVEKNSEFCIKENLDYYMMTDEGGRVSKAYGTSLSLPGMGTFSNRRTYIIDPNKIVRWVYVDVEGHISEHPAEVLERLKVLQKR